MGDVPHWLRSVRQGSEVQRATCWNLESSSTDCAATSWPATSETIRDTMAEGLPGAGGRHRQAECRFERAAKHLGRRPASDDKLRQTGAGFQDRNWFSQARRRARSSARDSLDDLQALERN